MLRHPDGQSLIDVAKIFGGKGVAVIFAVAHHKKLAARLSGRAVYPRLFTAGEDFQLGDGGHILFTDGGVA